MLTVGATRDSMTRDNRSGPDDDVRESNERALMCADFWFGARPGSRLIGSDCQIH